ncbi:OsmC family protein [Telmatobacter sp. DSM 110680]|uniref:OsmC family protein n=1 Tax=Telmatobacter sp. DSM 110680 TaxID=3036704 RepID=A0AAU7DMQ6_9BACT
MEVTVKQIDGLKFSVEARAHKVICDQPLENGGEDAGMTPPEFMLGSLGTCAEFYAVQYLRARRIDDAGVEVTVTAEKLMKPARLGNFRIQVRCPAQLSAEQTEGLQRSVHHCLIHNTLLSVPDVAIELTVGEPVLR